MRCGSVKRSISHRSPRLLGLTRTGRRSWLLARWYAILLGGRLAITAVGLAFLISVSASQNSLGAVINNNNGIENGMFTGNVIWGDDKTDISPLKVPLNLNIFFDSFCWTQGKFDMFNKTAVCHPGYQPFTNGPSGKVYSFYRPNDNTITDWKQKVSI